MAHDIPRLLKAIMAETGDKQTPLAARLSTKDVPISQPQVSRWLSGQAPEVPAYERILAVAAQLGIIDIRSEDVAASLPGKEGERPLTELDRPYPDAVPQMLNRMGAGGTGAVLTIDVGEMQSREEVGEWWRIPPNVLRGLARSDAAKTIGFAMDGADSMEPTILRTDIVFIDTGRRKVEPDGIWAVDYGFGRVLKRISARKTKGGLRFVLKSDNPNYPEEEYAPDEVTVFGRYVGRFSVF